MASLLSSSLLRSGPKLGNVSPSSLVKSAATLQNSVNTFNDYQAKTTYDNSLKTSADLNTYLTYLQGRMATLSSAGSITDLTKAAQMQQGMITATHASMSADIQRENIQIMSGNATPTDKLNLIQSQYQTALSIGDSALAQSLESTAYSLSQTIQVQAQTALTASNTLTKAGAASENSVATQLQDKLIQLNSDVGTGGMGALNTALKSFASDPQTKSQLTALANGPNVDPATKASILNALNTSQPNYMDIVAGVGAAIMSAHYLAYQQALPVDPAAAQGYFDSASAIANGTSKIHTLAGDLSMQDIQTAQTQPGMLVPYVDANTGSLKFSFGGGSKLSGTSSISGYKYDANGNVVANFTGAVAGTQINNNQVTSVDKQLQNLGFSFSKLNTTSSGTSNLTNGITVQFSKTPTWLQQASGGISNEATKVYVTPQGLQLAWINAAGKQMIGLIAQDTTGKNALYLGSSDKSGNLTFGKQVAAGEYGFNQSQNSLVNQVTNPSSIKTNEIKVTNSMHNGMGGTFGFSNAENNIAAIFNGARAMWNNIMNMKTQNANINPVVTNASLPNFQVAPTPTPAQVKVQPMPTLAPPASSTVVQPASGSASIGTPVGSSSVSGSPALGGIGGSSSLSGGGGIKL